MDAGRERHAPLEIRHAECPLQEDTAVLGGADHAARRLGRGVLAEYRVHATHERGLRRERSRVEEQDEAEG
jgi:hypothetical protein